MQVGSGRRIVVCGCIFARAKKGPIKVQQEDGKENAKRNRGRKPNCAGRMYSKRYASVVRTRIDIRGVREVG
jgi:hypothetical protein